MSPAPQPTNAFTGINLACWRGERPIFARLSFSLMPGGALLLRGPNGSGKSSLLHLLTGLARPETGEIRWRATPIADDLVAHRARLHFIGHLDAIKPTLTVAEMLDFWSVMRRGGKVTESVLAYFDLARLAPVPCRSLSAGERKRVSLARLIASPADLWLLDEPTNNLDVAAAAALLRAIADHRKRGGYVVIATHVPLDISDSMTLSLEQFAPRTVRAA